MFKSQTVQLWSVTEPEIYFQFTFPQEVSDLCALHQVLPIASEWLLVSALLVPPHHKGQQVCRGEERAQDKELENCYLN